MRGALRGALRGARRRVGALPRGPLPAPRRSAPFLRQGRKRVVSQRGAVRGSRAVWRRCYLFHRCRIFQKNGMWKPVKRSPGDVKVVFKRDVSPCDASADCKGHVSSRRTPRGFDKVTSTAAYF